MNGLRGLIVLALIALAGCLTAAAANSVGPSALLRTDICLNGAWETVMNAGGERIPETGWQPRRVPAMPLATNPPAVSAWYRRSFTIPRDWAQPDRRFILQLEKVGHYAGVYCNGRLAAEHYGQYTPFEADLTGALQPGKVNEIAIYVHNASGKYVRAGAVLDDAVVGNAYRPAADGEFQRNWVGIVGDIVLSWRPTTHIADVFVIPSVREKRLEARVTAAGVKSGSAVTLRAVVLDGEKLVLRLPEKPVAADGTLSLEADWSNPVLWGPPPYGQPKLYVLRTELLRQGKVIDRTFTRFGFREVWVEGRDVLLNGKKLWMSGTYFPKLSPVRYLNDRRVESRTIAVMQASGLNTLHGHWDDLGAPWLELCDEMGMLVLGAFFCDGRPQIQSRADPGWTEWMGATTREWVRARRNHPSIVAWRPTDVLPPNVPASREQFAAGLAEYVRREDGTRPLADGSDIAAWSQSPFKDPQAREGEYDDGARMAAALAASTKPFLTKEIYGGFADLENMTRFFRAFYDKSTAGGGAGVIVQHLPLIQRLGPFQMQWLSESGRGNRDGGPGGSQLPNWCDASQPAWSPTLYSRLFAELYQKAMNQAQAPYSGETAGELLVSGLAPDEVAILAPRDPGLAEAVGVRAAADGTAWIVAPPGTYRLHYRDGSREVIVQPARFSEKPGYEYVQRISIEPKRNSSK
jgi:hypothetical protein